MVTDVQAELGSVSAVERLEFSFTLKPIHHVQSQDEDSAYKDTNTSCPALHGLDGINEAAQCDESGAETGRNFYGTAKSSELNLHRLEVEVAGRDAKCIDSKRDGQGLFGFHSWILT